MPYFIADPALIAQWKRELPPTAEFRVGIAWQGNPRYRRDRQRSFRLEQLEPLARLGGVRLFSIQKGPGTDQIGQLGGRFDVPNWAAGSTTSWIPRR